MKAERIYFERTKSLPGYNNVKVGIQIQIEENEKASDVLRKAETFVANALEERPNADKIDEVLHLLGGMNKKADDLPF